MAKLTNEIESIKLRCEGVLQNQTLEVDLNGDASDYNDYSIHLSIDGKRNDVSKLFDKLGLFTDICDKAKFEEHIADERAENRRTTGKRATSIQNY